MFMNIFRNSQFSTTPLRKPSNDITFPMRFELFPIRREQEMGFHNLVNLSQKNNSSFPLAELNARTRANLRFLQSQRNLQSAMMTNFTDEKTTHCAPVLINYFSLQPAHSSRCDAFCIWRWKHCLHQIRPETTTKLLRQWKCFFFLHTLYSFP